MYWDRTGAPRTAFRFQVAPEVVQRTSVPVGRWKSTYRPNIHILRKMASHRRGYWCLSADGVYPRRSCRTAAWRGKPPRQPLRHRPPAPDLSSVLPECRLTAPSQDTMRHRHSRPLVAAEWKAAGLDGQWHRVHP